MVLSYRQPEGLCRILSCHMVIVGRFGRQVVKGRYKKKANSNYDEGDVFINSNIATHNRADINSLTKKWIIIFAAICIIIIFRTYVLGKIEVVGVSMVNTLNEGDICWVSKHSYFPNRYDVVVVHVDGMNLVKRIIALPDETVTITNGYVFVDDIILNNSMYALADDGGVASSGLLLGDGEYFILGDNRDESTDSRYYGAIDKDDIKGRVVYRIYPFNNIGGVR